MAFAYWGVRDTTMKSYLNAVLIIWVGCVSASLQAESCPAMTVYKLPFSYGTTVLITDLNLGIPITRLDVPWDRLEVGGPSNSANLALRETLKAVYENDVSLAERHIAASQIAKVGTTREFLTAFRSNLSNKGQVRIHGRIDEPNAVRFVFSGDNEKSYRVLTFIHNGNGEYVLDNGRIPTTAEMLENSIFQIGKTAEIDSTIDLHDYTSIPLGPQTNPCRPELIAKIEPTSKLLFKDGHISSNPAVRFYQACHGAIESGDMHRFFACFGPEGGSRMGEMFARLSGDETSRFIKAQVGGIEPKYVLNGGSLTVILFRRSVPPDSLLVHQDIVSLGDFFQLVYPLTSGVLDDLLDDRQFQAELEKTVAALQTQ